MENEVEVEILPAPFRPQTPQEAYWFGRLKESIRHRRTFGHGTMRTSGLYAIKRLREFIALRPKYDPYTKTYE